MARATLIKPLKDKSCLLMDTVQTILIRPSNEIVIISFLLVIIMIGFRKRIEM